MRENTDPDYWVDEYADYLYGYAYSRLNNVHKAEDVLQETFLAGVKSLDKYDGRVPIKYWLRGIMRYKIIDSIKANMKEMNESELDSFPEEKLKDFKRFGIFSRKVAAWDFSPRETFENQEFWQIFSKCLEKMKDPLRSIYMFKEVDGLSSEEVCKAFSISDSNLWVITHRARKQMKQCLNKNWGDSYK